MLINRLLKLPPAPASCRFELVLAPQWTSQIHPHTFLVLNKEVFCTTHLVNRHFNHVSVRNFLRSLFHGPGESRRVPSEV